MSTKTMFVAGDVRARRDPPARRVPVNMIQGSDRLYFKVRGYTLCALRNDGVLILYRMNRTMLPFLQFDGQRVKAVGGMDAEIEVHMEGECDDL